MTSSGQIQTKAALDHETQASYTVDVSVTDGTATATIAVTITVTDVAEPPDAPGAPGVFAPAGTTDTLSVSWTAPETTGRPDIDDYDVQYSVDGSGTWMESAHAGTGLSATITGLSAGTVYEVQVRAGNDEGAGAWSASGRAATGSPPTEVPSDWGLIPSGLTTGDSFRLLFIPTTAIHASSPDIHVYNTWVQARAAAGHADIQAYSHTFRMVGSTEAVDARENTATTGTGVPIYWLGGAKVADDYADFYDGDWDEEASGRRETGAEVTLTSSWELWTGSTAEGTELLAPDTSSRALGNAGGKYVGVGRPNHGTHGPLRGNTKDRIQSKAVYALSGVFTVGAVTVPGNWALKPDGLGTGDSFRLLFATSTTRGASSSDIADYNTFVQTAAAAGHADIQAHSAFFRVVGGTSATDARDNTLTTYTSDDQGLPIYWLGGNKVADHYADFYDGDWDDEANATDESGSGRTISSGQDRPYTGSGHDGTEPFSGGDSFALGQSGNGVVIARPNDASDGAGPLSSDSFEGVVSTARPFYALSPVFVVGSGVTVPSNWSLNPTGLTTGDAFRLLFATSTARNATDTDIADYNTFVQTRAAAGHAAIQDYSSGFRAVGSTADTDARDNTASTFDAMSDDKGPPIYWLGGNKVADNYEDFYDGDWDDEANATDESGSARDLSDSDDGAPPWTGSKNDGTEDFTTTNTSRALGSQFVTVGKPNSSTSGEDPLNSGSADIKSSAKPFYALSAVFRVGSQVVAISDPAATAFALSVSPASLAEDAGATTVTVTATLNGAALATATEVTVSEVAGAGTATSGTDYTAVSQFTLTIQANQASGTGTFEFTPSSDGTAEGNETVVLSGTTTDLGSATAELTISDPAATAFALSVSPASLAEDAGATTVTVTATLNGAALATATVVTVSEVAGGTATSGTDYTAVSQFTLTIQANQASGTGTFEFTPTSDGMAEGDETVRLSGTTTDLGSATAELTISDPAATGFALSLNPASVAEDAGATTVTVTAALNGAALATATEVTVSDGGGGTATSGTDYAAVSQFTLTIQANQASGTGTFEFTPTSDGMAEGDETVRLSGTTTDLGSATAELTISDPAATAFALSLNPASVAEDAGATTVTVTATLNGAALPTATEVTVSEVAGGTATSGTDYTAVSQFTLTIQANQASGTGTFEFTPSSDGMAEGNETVRLSGTTTDLGSATAELTISDPAATAFALSLNPASVAEDAGATTVTVTATLNGAALPTATEVTVSEVAGGTATSGTDYTAVSQFTLTIQANQASGTGTFEFTPSSDGMAEGNETVRLSGTTTDLGSATAELTISDPAATAFALSLSPASLAEDAGATTVTVTATLNGAALATATEVTVSDGGGGTATSGTDYTAVSQFTLTIQANQASGTGTFEFTPTSDGMAEGDETVRLSGTTTDLGSATAELTISDPAATAFALSLNPASVAEDAGATTVTVTATLNGAALPTATEVTVSEVAGGTATSGTDYTAVSQFTLTIQANQASGTGTFEFTPSSDGMAEGNETVRLSGTTTDLGSATAELTISDPAATGFALSLNPASVAEDAGSTTVTVTAALNGAALPTATEVTVSEVAGGTATSGTDYTAVSQFTLTIAATETSGTGTFEFTPSSDGMAEGNETVRLSGTTTDLGSATAELTISDPAATGFALSLNPASVAEDAGSTTVTVTAALNGAALPTATEVTVSEVAGGTATSGTDYTAVSQFTLTIAATETSGTGTFEFTPSSDGMAEGNETMRLSGTTTDLGSATAELTISDPAATGFALSLNPASVAEDAGATTVTVTAALNGAALATATVVTVSEVAGGTATSGTDYTAVSQFTLTIAATETSGTGTFEFTPSSDGMAEGNETMRLSGTTTDLGSATADLTISDPAGGEDADGGNVGHRRRRRAGQRKLQLPVAGERRGHHRRNQFQLHAGGRRRWPDHQGEGVVL